MDEDHNHNGQWKSNRHESDDTMQMLAIGCGSFVVILTICLILIILLT